MRRFYKTVEIAECDGGWRVLLDGRGIKTPQRKNQIAPNLAIAELLAEEWRAQGDKIDPATFPQRDLADYAVDQIGSDPATTIDALLRYAETDTLCYRADPDEPLYHRQLAVWEPVLAGVETRHGLHFERVSGIMHRAQPTETLVSLRGLLEKLNPYTLAALVTLASLTASLTISLATLDEGADAEALWDAANLEEEWQAELWGRDALAEARKEKRKGEFLRAVNFARLALTG